MKKLLLFLVLGLFTFGLAACTPEEEELDSDYLNQPYADQTITIYFVPSIPADEILEYTEPLADMVVEQLANMGIEVAGVEILVSSSYEAAGEALLSGTGDVGFLPGGTYVMYADEDNSPVDVILTATRAGLTKDSSNAADWNDGEPTEGDSEYQVGYYKGLIVAGTSDAARTVADKVNAGNTLVWDDVKDLNWCVRSATSSSGYIYPNIWLMENFDGKTFDDITNLTETSGYGDTMASLATGTCDVGTIYADARRDYADDWTSSYARTESVWAETDVIGVTANIYNDTISISNVNIDERLEMALTLAFINIANTEAGLAVMEVYSHEGYVIADDSDYDDARTASDLSN